MKNRLSIEAQPKTCLFTALPLPAKEPTVTCHFTSSCFVYRMPSEECVQANPGKLPAVDPLCTALWLGILIFQAQWERTFSPCFRLPLPHKVRICT